MKRQKIRIGELDLIVEEYDNLGNKNSDLDPELKEKIPEMVKHLNHVLKESNKGSDEGYRYDEDEIKLMRFYKDDMLDRLKDSYVALIFHDDKLIGSCSIVNQRHEFEESDVHPRIKYFYVNNDYQGKGIGKFLHGLRIGKAKEKGYSELKGICLNQDDALKKHKALGASIGKKVQITFDKEKTGSEKGLTLKYHDVTYKIK